MESAAEKRGCKVHRRHYYYHEAVAGDVLERTDKMEIEGVLYYLSTYIFSLCVILGVS
jgi:hypothetical protein